MYDNYKLMIFETETILTCDIDFIDYKGYYPRAWQRREKNNTHDSVGARSSWSLSRTPAQKQRAANITSTRCERLKCRTDHTNKHDGDV
jgi:hypothetical protein